MVISLFSHDFLKVQLIANTAFKDIINYSSLTTVAQHLVSRW